MFWWIKLSCQLYPSILLQAFKQCYKPLTQDTLWQPWCASFIFKIILHNLCPHHYNHRRFLLPPSSEKFKVRSPAKLADITHPSLTVTECDVFRFLVFFSHQTNTFFVNLFSARSSWAAIWVGTMPSSPASDSNLKSRLSRQSLTFNFKPERSKTWKYFKGQKAPFILLASEQLVAIAPIRSHLLQLNQCK